MTMTTEHRTTTTLLGACERLSELLPEIFRLEDTILTLPSGRGIDLDNPSEADAEAVGEEIEVQCALRGWRITSHLDIFRRATVTVHTSARYYEVEGRIGLVVAVLAFTAALEAEG